MIVRLLVASLTFIIGIAQAADQPPRRPPNIVMIAVDDLNNWIGAMGGPARTPNMDRLATSGTLFNNAYCVVPSCNPSRVALMTGLRPETTGQYTNEGNFRDLRPENQTLPTLAQRFRALGYRALSAGKIFHADRGRHPEPHVLSDPVSWDDQYVGGTGTEVPAEYRDERGWARWLGGERRGINDYGLGSAIWGPTPEKKEETADWKSAAYCAGIISQKHDQPYFLACGLARPHAPLVAPQEFFDLYPLDKVLVPYAPAEDLADLPAIARNHRSNFLVRAIREKGELQRAVQGYLASISFADACVGQILDAVERSPDRDNTIVILWGDHGWQLGHKERWEKFSLWKQGANTPFIIRAPGYKPGVTHRAVSLLDLAPTLLELLGAPVPSEFEGTSLTPWMRDPSAPREAPAVVTLNLVGNHSVVHEHWNYIRYRDGSEELYDHRSDPAEYTNLIGKPGSDEIVARLRQHLPATLTADLAREDARERARIKK